MSNFLSITRLGFQNPWEVKKTMFLERQRYDPNAYTEKDKEDIRQTAAEAREEGSNTAYFKGVDQIVDLESQKEKADLLDELKAFQNTTGIDQSKAIQKAEKCTQKWELEALKEKLLKSGLEYLHDPKNKTGLIQKSKAYVPMHAAETKAVKAKEDDFVAFIESLPVFAKGGKDSVASVIANFDKFVGPRIQFRNLLRNQTKFVKTLFFQMLKREQDPRAHEPAILGKAMETIKKVEGFPQAVQKEFHDAVEEGKDPEKSYTELTERFKKVTGEYDQIVMNKDCFGGKFIQTPKGKMRAAKWEYTQWHKNEFESLGKMEEMLKALKESEIPKREKVYAKRNALLTHFPPDQAENLRGKTDDMRFHNLKAYVKDLESLAGKQSIHALEYMAILESEEHQGVELFTREEKTQLKADILKDKPEIQALELQLLKAKGVQSRQDVVQEFKDLPEHLQLGQAKKFKAMSFEQRKRFLQKVQTTQNRPSTNPFGKIDGDLMDKKTRERQAIKQLRSQEGKSFLRRKMETEEAGKEAGVVAETTQRIGGWVKQLNSKGLTQMEGRLEEDAHFGLHGRNDKIWKVGFDNSLAQNEEEQRLGNTFVSDVLLRNAGGDRKSGGQVVEGGLHVVTAQMVRDGDERIIHEMDAAAYDNMVMFTGTDGKDDLNLKNSLEKSWLDKKEVLIKTLVQLLGLEGASEEFIDELTYATAEIDDSIADTDEYFGIQAANGSDHYSEEEEESQAA
jgi:hypothetical protein